PTVPAVLKGLRRLDVTVTAPLSGHDRLQSLHFVSLENSVIDARGQIGLGANSSVNLPPGTQQADFSIRRPTPGEPSTVNLLVVDSCGEWPTVVGGGRSPF